MDEGSHVTVNADRVLDPVCGGTTAVASLVSHTRALAGQPMSTPRRDSKSPADGQEKAEVWHLTRFFALSHIGRFHLLQRWRRETGDCTRYRHHKAYSMSATCRRKHIQHVLFCQRQQKEQCPNLFSNQKLASTYQALF